MQSAKSNGLVTCKLKRSVNRGKPPILNLKDEAESASYARLTFDTTMACYIMELSCIHIQIMVH